MPIAAEISVVGGGWSVRDIDLNRLPGLVIGVNDSAVHTACDITVSMDRLWTEYRWPELRTMGKPAYIRRSAIQKLKNPRFPWLNVFECDHTSVEFSEDRFVLNGTNSGVCAINKAYQLRPERIYLFGFDMNRSPDGDAYWYPPYPWVKPEGATSGSRYAEWTAQFARIRHLCDSARIHIINCSPKSAITVFDKTSEFMKGKAAA